MHIERRTGVPKCYAGSSLSQSCRKAGQERGRDLPHTGENDGYEGEVPPATPVAAPTTLQVPLVDALDLETQCSYHLEVQGNWLNA